LLAQIRDRLLDLKFACLQIEFFDANQRLIEITSMHENIVQIEQGSFCGYDKFNV